MDTIAIRSSRGEGVVLGCKQVERSDIVAGNRYGERWGADGRSFIPDESGDWTALVTYRGPNAPERPKVLPVGTRVRLREQKSWQKYRTGTVVAPNRLNGDTGPIQDGWWNMDWDGYGRNLRAHTDELEALSLPTDATPKPIGPVGIKAQEPFVTPETPPLPKDKAAQGRHLVTADQQREISARTSKVSGSFAAMEQASKRTGYDGDDRACDNDIADGHTVRDIKGQHLARRAGCPTVSSLTDYTPPEVLRRRKPEPVKVRVDSGWNDPD